MMIFGPAGIPLQAKGGTLEGIQWAAAHGLAAYEIEFVHGVRMKPETAKEVGAFVQKAKHTVSCHAPYYLNLLSEKELTVKNSHGMILQSCAALDGCNGSRVVIHTGFYQGMSREKAFVRVLEEYTQIVGQMEKQGLDVILAPEVTGKLSQFGDIQELYSLAKEIGLEKLNPCIDFGHLHAKSQGKMTDKQAFLSVFDEVEKIAGRKALETLHIHFTGIEFGEKGEKKHLPLSSNSPPFLPLAQALKERKCKGTIISESPLIEKDALEMKRIYESV